MGETIKRNLRIYTGEKMKENEKYLFKREIRFFCKYILSLIGNFLQFLNERSNYETDRHDLLGFSQGFNARKVNFAVVYTLRTYWAEFVNKNRCISVRLVSEEDKSI